jgi:O-methyltransferase
MKLLSSQVNEREITVIIRELSKLLANNTPGDVVEFGCYIGTTSIFLAEKLQKTNRHLWLYDSFAGLPEKTKEDASAAGDHFKAGELLATRKQLEHNLRQFDRQLFFIKKAWFSDLTEKDIPDKIAFAFLDGDYYKSIVDPLRLIWSHMAPGGIIIVDDYDNPALPGAAKAVHEWGKAHNLKMHHEHGLALLRSPSHRLE